MMSMVMFLAGVAAGVVLGAALGWRGLAVLAAVGIALLLATTSGIDLAALGAQLGEYVATLTALCANIAETLRPLKLV